MGGSNLSLQGDYPLGAAENAPRPADSFSTVLWRQRSVVVLTVVLFLITGLIYFFLARRMYTSTGRIIIDAGRNDNADMISRELATQSELIGSTPIIILRPGR